MKKITLNDDILSVEFVRSSPDRPGGRRLVAVDNVGVFHMVGEEFDALGRTVHQRKIEILPAHLDHFAGMLMDPMCLSDKHEASLDEPIYPYKVLVKWDGVHRVLSLISRPMPKNPQGSVEFRIRLSPLEARRLARLAERCAFAAHFAAILARIG